LNIQLLHGSAATDLRWSGRFYFIFFYSSSENAIVKELLKLANICKSYQKINVSRFLWDTV